MDTEQIMNKVRAAIAAREKSGQSKPKIAAELGVDTATVYRWADNEGQHYGRHLKAVGALFTLAKEGERIDQAA